MRGSGVNERLCDFPWAKGSEGRPGYPGAARRVRNGGRSRPWAAGVGGRGGAAVRADGRPRPVPRTVTGVRAAPFGPERLPRGRTGPRSWVPDGTGVRKGLGGRACGSVRRRVAGSPGPRGPVGGRVAAGGLGRRAGSAARAVREGTRPDRNGRTTTRTGLRGRHVPCPRRPAPEWPSGSERVSERPAPPFPLPVTRTPRHGGPESPVERRMAAPGVPSPCRWRGRNPSARPDAHGRVGEPLRRSGGRTPARERR